MKGLVADVIVTKGERSKSCRKKSRTQTSLNRIEPCESSKLLYEASYFPFLGPGENMGNADAIYSKKFLGYFDYLHEYWR